MSSPDFILHISPDLLQSKAEGMGLQLQVHPDWIGPRWEIRTASSDPPELVFGGAKVGRLLQQGINDAFERSCADFPLGIGKA